MLGAGVMGTGIAAHLAGAGIRTQLLDIVLPDQPRNALAEGALQRALKSKPATFFQPQDVQLVSAGNLEDNLSALADCDLVIEAVTERLDVKKSLFGRVAEFLAPGALLASNTSGLSIAAMNGGLPEAIRPRFLGMHFFNPVRYMHLLELVPGPDTAPASFERARQIGHYLGKGVVRAKDTPNFVANRIGMFSFMHTMHAMEAEGLSVEEVDAIVGTPMGRPKSAAFKTADIVGLDTFAHVAKNCFDALTADEHRQVFALPSWVTHLVEAGHLGRKSGAGFYKKEGGEILVFDTTALSYRPKKKVRFDAIGVARNIDNVRDRLKAVVSADDPAGRFAWKLLSESLAYSARRIPEIADSVVEIDRAMRWGFNWQLGPFEAWDAIGVRESVERMQRDGIAVPEAVEKMLQSGRTRFYESDAERTSYFDLAANKATELEPDPKHLALPTIKQAPTNIVAKNGSATLVDLKDGCLCVEVHTKMNTLDDDVVKMLLEGVERVERDHAALVIGNDGEHFGAGANLMLIYMGAQQGEWKQIETAVTALQDALQRVRYATVPVVAAPFQYTFGGCAEVAMACDGIQAHAETYMGLVEVGAGLVPAGGGCLRMLERWTDGLANVKGVNPLPFVGQASLQIASATVATGAHDARRLRFLRSHDGISLNRDHLLYEAKQKALGMARAGYRPPSPPQLFAAGQDAAATIAMQAWGMVESGYASEHDAKIARHIARILTGGDRPEGAPITEQDVLDLEREAFLSLCGEEKSQARMQSLLMNNKPLRN